MSTTATTTATTSATTDPRQAVIGELVFRCGWGDEAALADLFDRTYFLVVAVVHAADLASGTTQQSASQAAAAVLDAFRWIWHRSPNYVPTARPATDWLVDHVLDSLQQDRCETVPPSPIGLGATG